jgi:hypothetical protein
MFHRLSLHPKSYTTKQLVGRVHQILKSLAPNHLSWRSIGDSQEQMAAPFIGKRNDILGKLFSIEGIFGLFEFKDLRF